MLFCCKIKLKLRVDRVDIVYKKNDFFFSERIINFQCNNFLFISVAGIFFCVCLVNEMVILESNARWLVHIGHRHVDTQPNVSIFLCFGKKACLRHLEDTKVCN